MSLFRRRFTTPGAAPGTVAPPRGEAAPSIHTICYGSDVCDVATPDTPAAAIAHRRRDAVLWIDVRGLGDGKLVKEFGEALELHPLAVSDIMNVGQRPKVDLYDGFTFIVLRMVTVDQDGALQWEQVSLALGDNYVLTFQETPTDCLETLRQRIRKGRPTVRNSGADYLACMIVDAIVDGYFPVLEHYGNALEELEDEVFSGPQGDLINRLYMLKREQASFRHAAWPTRDALAQLLRDDGSRIHQTAILYLRDTQDHVLQVVEVAESYRELSTGLVDVYLSMIGQKTNDVMRVLTVVATLFIPLTFVAGVYGMNFERMPELAWSHGYGFFWALCGAIAIALLFLFGRLGWLRAR